MICRGNVLNGRCYSCGDSVPGVPAFSFKATIIECGDGEDLPKLSVICADGAGNSMFGCTAEAFRALTDDGRADLIENISNVPITCGLMMKYDPDKDDEMMCIYDVALASTM